MLIIEVPPEAEMRNLRVGVDILRENWGRAALRYDAWTTGRDDIGTAVNGEWRREWSSSVTDCCW